jgi:hypothetical protein
MIAFRRKRDSYADCVGRGMEGRRGKTSKHEMKINKIKSQNNIFLKDLLYYFMY